MGKTGGKCVPPSKFLPFFPFSYYSLSLRQSIVGVTQAGNCSFSNNRLLPIIVIAIDILFFHKLNGESIILDSDLFLKFFSFIVRIHLGSIARWEIDLLMFLSLSKHSLKSHKVILILYLHNFLY